MYDLPQYFSHLSPKRQFTLQTVVINERQDAAMNGVMIGLKALNHVHGYGLQRLAALSRTWESEIKEFYKGDALIVDGFRHIGEHVPITDIAEKFNDLSESMQRKIAALIRNKRQEAQWNAISIGEKVIRRELGFGDHRMQPLLRQWESDIINFYEDRELYEIRLHEWMQDGIGFLVEDGKLSSYRTEDGKPVHQRVAERRLKEQEDKYNSLSRN